MYPFLAPEIFGNNIPLFDVLLAIGIFSLFFYVIKRFENRDGFSKDETNRLLILISISLIIALGSAFIFDAVFHTIKNGELTYGSVTFIGGLVGGIVTFLILYKYFYKYENKNLRRVMSTIIPGVVLAHAFGRIGCFLAGCCFGIPTESVLGVVFPHGDAHSLYDSAVLPTQLFESAFLFALFIVLDKVGKIQNYRIETYVIVYGSWRIFIEFFRGDDRGSFLSLFSTQYNTFPTPSQFLSLLMILFGGYLLYNRFNIKKPILKWY